MDFREHPVRTLNGFPDKRLHNPVFPVIQKVRSLNLFWFQASKINNLRIRLRNNLQEVPDNNIVEMSFL